MAPSLCRSFFAGRAFEIVCPKAQTHYTALIFRDSYFQGVQSYVSSYFQRSIFVWKDATPVLFEFFVGRRRPDVVIEEQVEHTLYD